MIDLLMNQLMQINTTKTKDDHDIISNNIDLIFQPDDIESSQSGEHKEIENDDVYGNDDTLFTLPRHCKIFLEALFMERTEYPVRLRDAKEYPATKWSEDECRRMLERCDQIRERRIPFERKWLPNAIKMQSKLGPNV